MRWFSNFHFVQLFYERDSYISYSPPYWTYVYLLQQICISTML